MRAMKHNEWDGAVAIGQKPPKRAVRLEPSQISRFPCSAQTIP
jgi:hypothetical protein